MAVVTTTRLLRGRSAVFGQQFLVQMSDGSALASPVQLSVANDNALTGFPPGTDAVLKADVPANDPTTGPGWQPNPQQVRVIPFTTSADSNTPGVGSATLDEASFVRDTDDDSGTSVKCDIYVTASTVFKLIVEVLD